MEKNETIQAIIDQYRDYFSPSEYRLEDLIYSIDTAMILSRKAMDAIRAKAQLASIIYLIQGGKLKLK